MLEIFQKINQGQYHQAERDLVEILKNNPEDRDALLVLADMYMHLGRFQESAAVGRQLIEVLPDDDPRGCFGLGCALARLGRLNLAFDFLEQADNIFPGHPETLRNMGWVKCMLGESDLGRRLLKKSIEIDPQNLPVYVDMAMSYHFFGDYKTALDWIKKGQAFDDNNPFLRQNKKMIQEMQQEFNALPLEEQEKRLDQLQDPNYHKQMRIQMILTLAGEASEDDAKEIEEELKRLGLKGIAHQISDPNSAEGKASLEYIEFHKEIKAEALQELSSASPELSSVSQKKLNKKQVQALAQELEGKMQSSLFDRRQKEIILTLAHQGTIEALRALEEIVSKIKSNKGDAQEWLKLAVDECKAFLKSDLLDEPGVIVRRLEKI